MFSKTTSNPEEIIKLISFIYSIPCSNAFTEGMFNQLKHEWTPSRNSMSVEAIAAELQIRLNGHMKCDDFFLDAQNELELIQSAPCIQRYNFKKKKFIYII